MNQIIRINGDHPSRVARVLPAVLLLISSMALNVTAERLSLAVIAPEDSEQTLEVQNEFGRVLASNADVLDFSLSRSVWRSKQFKTPFNLTLEQSRNVGAAIGSDYFLILRTDSMRRFSLESKSYSESYLAVYAVSTRTGRLAYWKLKSVKGDTLAVSKKLLIRALKELSIDLLNNLKRSYAQEVGEEQVEVEELSPDVYAEDKNFRPPMPFRRLRPKYTDLAYLYSVAATVDVLVDVDKNGRVTRTEVVRWGGFGLDDSARNAIKTMNWRPAERNGKFLPMRILLRYNFRKLEKD